MIDIQSLKQQHSIANVLLLLGVQIRHAVSGSFSIACPAHADVHPSLVIMPNTNYFECKSCSKKGDIISLVQLFKNCTFKEAIAFLGGEDTQPVVSQRIEPDQYLKYRGILPETAQKFGIQVINDILEIPIPTGKKMRRINPKPTDDKYIQTTGSSTCLYKAGEHAKELIVCEGELDAVILFQNTHMTAWTGSTGAGTFKRDWITEFDGVEKIYLGLDNDTEGDKGAEKIADMLGKERCYRLRPPHGKDWTEFYQLGGTSEEFANACLKAPSMVQVIVSTTLQDKFTNRTIPSIEKFETVFRGLNASTNGLRAGGTYVLGGAEKSGKSSIVFSLINDWIEKGIKVGLVNTEQQLQDFVTRISSNDSIIPEREVDEDIKNKWIETHPLEYAGVEDINNDKNFLDFEKAIEKIKDFVSKGVKIIVVDNLSTFATDTQDKREYEIISSCLSRLVTFAKVNNVVLIPIIHIKKGLEIKENPEHILKLLDEGKAKEIFSKSITVMRRPTTSDLYGGGLGQSQVAGAFLLWRPYQKYSDLDVSSMATLIIDSISHGSNADIPLVFTGPCYRYDEEGIARVQQVKIAQEDEDEALAHQLDSERRS